LQSAPHSAVTANEAGALLGVRVRPDSSLRGVGGAFQKRLRAHLYAGSGAAAIEAMRRGTVLAQGKFARTADNCGALAGASFRRRDTLVEASGWVPVTSVRVLRRYGRRNQLLQRHELRRIDSGVAGGAVGGLLTFGAGRAQAVQREVRQGIGAHVVADLLDRL